MAWSLPRVGRQLAGQAETGEVCLQPADAVGQLEATASLFEA
jgi:hypothetical protein